MVPIPDPGVKMALDPGSATTIRTQITVVAARPATILATLPLLWIFCRVN
jgi:hypothetical protein